MSGPNLGCPVTAIEYNFDKNRGEVHMASDMCTDMKATVEYFKRIDPDVVHIITWQDGNLDTQYVYHGDTAGDYKWIAI